MAQGSPVRAQPSKARRSRPGGSLRLAVGFVALNALWLFTALALRVASGTSARGVIFGGSILVASGVIAWAILGRQASVGAWLAFVLVLGIWLASIIPLTRMASYRFSRLYEAITPGMTRAEVLAEVDRYFPDTEPMLFLDESGIGSYQHYKHLEWRTLPDWSIGLQMVEGRVVNKQYLQTD